MFVLLNPEFAEIVPDNQYNETSVDFHYSSPFSPSWQLRIYAQPLQISTAEYAADVTKIIFDYFEEYFDMEYSIEKLGKLADTLICHWPLYNLKQLYTSWSHKKIQWLMFPIISYQLIHILSIYAMIIVRKEHWIYSVSVADKIAIPDFGTGAMENWGLITYRETNLLFDENESSSINKQRVASVIAHELVHQVTNSITYLIFERGKVMIF